jgi:hypothetical protein
MKPKAIQRKKLIAAASAFVALSGFYVLPAQQGRAEEPESLSVEHAECVFLGPKQKHFKKNSLEAQLLREFEYSRITQEVAARLPAPASAGKSERLTTAPGNVIDRHLFQAWKEAGATPAAKTNDFEFIRRATLDLTGRVPTVLRVQQFVNDLNPNKRALLVDELLNSEGWVDKWTMFFGDLYKSTARTTQVNRYPDGRNAFHEWIRKSLAENKSYSRMATEVISAVGTNSYEQGDLNWILGGFVTGGPVQDLFDQMAVNVADTFLGVSHFNCVMCHDGRRHLDTLSLWGQSASRYQAYQMAAFFSRTSLLRLRVNPNDPNPYYWTVEDNTRLRTDYNLNTTTGNRPPRTTVGTIRVVSPEYSFNGNKPRSGENYRVALAREVTSDLQFARAGVNYIWKEFMGKAFVEPTNQFDPARLDPDNPPPDPWKLQPNQPRLLNELAREFVNMKFDLKALMRLIVNSEAYQLSSRYEGEWNPAWENLYARKLVRRLWAEEIHDALVFTSNIPVTYNVRGVGALTWAMKFPDVVGIPGGNTNSFLDSFMRGNRDTEDRRTEASSLQVLNLMNDTFVMTRTRPSGTGEAASLMRRALTGNDDQLVSTLFITVLSRYPNDEEKAAALDYLRSGNRQQKAEDLLWSLYNKVDFIFNY